MGYSLKLSIIVLFIKLHVALFSLNESKCFIFNLSLKPGHHRLSVLLLISNFMTYM
jgi:hypothetical protein